MERREAGNVKPRQQRTHIAPKSGEQDPVGETQFADELLDRGPLLAITHNDEAQVRTIRSQTGHSPQQHAVCFLRAQPGDDPEHYRILGTPSVRRASDVLLVLGRGRPRCRCR